jgi:hypothetical protein
MSAHGASPKSNRMDAQGCDTRPPRLQAGEGVVFSALTPNPSPTLWELIPIAEPEFTKVRINENPLLKVPPASRGNRVGAPFAVPLAKRGEPAGGGQLMNFGRAIGIRGVGFFSRGWRGRRDARVPSTARAGSASVSLAWRQRCAAWQRREQARLQKTYPFKPCGRGERFAESCGVRKRQLQRLAEAPLPHSTPPSPACRRGGQRANLLECGSGSFSVRRKLRFHTPHLLTRLASEGDARAHRRSNRELHLYG